MVVVVVVVVAVGAVAGTPVAVEAVAGTPVAVVVVAVAAVAGTPVAQVFVGSCVNSSLENLEAVAAVLKGKTVHPDVSLVVAPGSKQVYSMIAESGALADLIASGARILESACGPCVGMGQAPPTGTVSLRTSTRNFKGRSGTADDQVYLASPVTCDAG